VLSDGSGRPILSRVLKDPDARWLVFRINNFLNARNNARTVE
jgi:hypothetical protein